MRKKIIVVLLLSVIVFVCFYFINRQKVQGVKISPNQAKISEIVRFISNMQPSEVNVMLDETVLTTAILGGPVILLDLNHMPDDWQNTLQMIWERSRITARYPVKVDLRFKSPILTYGKE
jgi:hypothetical protein